jgi:lipopolysaccharide transport system ATP-binding protein
MTVISVENVSKSYRLGQIGGGTLKEDFARWCARLQGKPDPSLKIGEERKTEVRRRKSDVNGQTSGLRPPASDIFWALDNVSFEVKEGEVLGIIGRNGAGKSTLLKILSQVTTPTSGQIKIKGRIASLLEVGTGFNPEMTGRENVFLNGAILGMTKAEIRKTFDEIVAFSGVEEFIDTPVKRYSSGMYVRLAFAVAAHLEPEILIVDEVLAVGDVEFQKKCLGKMKDVAGHGRTILFVSHNMGALSKLCSKGVLLESGKVKLIGSADACISSYLSRDKEISLESFSNRSPIENQKLLIKRLRIKTNEHNNSIVLNNANEISLEVLFEVLSPGSSYAISFELIDSQDAAVMCSTSLDSRPAKDLGTYQALGEYAAEVKLPAHWLRTGQYFIRVASAVPSVCLLDTFPGLVSFTIHDTTTPIAILGEGRTGPLVPRLEWTVSKL